VTRANARRGICSVAQQFQPSKANKVNEAKDGTRNLVTTIAGWTTVHGEVVVVGR